MAKSKPLSVAVLLAGIAFALTVSAARAAAEQGASDDWEVVQPAPVSGGGSRQTPADAPAEPAPPVASSANDVFVACGETVRAAQEPYLSIVATLNNVWGSAAKIYETVAPSGPHARGNCIFYNREYLQELTANWMGIKDQDQLEPMLYAIDAHELGHIVHGDLTAARAGVPVMTKELEADRFAGYTLWRLHSDRFDAEETERYYQAVGDDFVGAQGDHGTSKQRITAFQEGWDLARMGLAEDSNERPAGGLDAGDLSAPIDP